MKRLSFIFLLLAGCASTPQWGTPNLARVAPNVWRGGQPDAVGFALLKRQGVRVIVKLNMESEGSDAVAEELGMTVYRFPITFTEQMMGPSETTINAAVRCIKTHSIDGVYVHCLHGQDRTGLVVAAYLRGKGWTKQSARADMLAHGFHKSLIGLDWYWNEKIK